MDPLALHTYDRQVKYCYMSKFNYQEDQVKQIISIGDRLTDGKDMFDLLIQSIGTPWNIDNINQCSVDQLLYDLANIIDKIDIKVLEEQLIDLRTGPCPQGRSLRLIQVIQTCQPPINEPNAIGVNDQPTDYVGDANATDCTCCTGAVGTTGNNQLNFIS